ncbi:MFS transporter [Actinoplanes couchii]|uniref:MFS transporter n=1 Tax=Actinoplanes couchii TaxID=403638 RepID=A0ABQ3XP99_9ACTN|nr:MFS transporter [Actinoplanes couchii]MDR6318632.1 MFS family permease [Actinoplanes couchii]GID60240.1 MFS transporter [Actinoplanes couchii]
MAIAEPVAKVSGRYIFWMMAANFGVSMAFIVPIAFSLAVRIDELAPGREEVLGYVTGTAQAVFLVLSPLIGVWSDRTRNRFGRRRPLMLAGAVLGLAALFAIAVAPNLLLVAAGWMLAMLGWATVSQLILSAQADRVPEEQRGRISGFTGLTGQIAPIMGVGITSLVSGSTFLVFVLPGLIGAALLTGFLIAGKEPDSRNLPPAAPVSARGLLSSYVFNPREHPDFGWNWLGRLAFFMGLYFNTTFSTFFYAQRLGLPVREVAATVALIGVVGVFAAAAGALGGGYLSDRLQRRRMFALIGSLFFVVGAVVEAFAHAFVPLLIGSVLMQLAIAFFSAVDQAIVLAVLPSREEAGRYIAVVQFAHKLPSALAPLIAPFIIAIGASGGEKNYTLLYLTGAVLALAGGLIVFTRIKSVR